MPVINSIIHPYPQLCTCCASLPWPSRPFQNDSLLEKIPFHKTFKLLNESADQGCALCRLVWSSLVYNCAATSYPKASWMEMSIDLEIFMTDSEFALISTLKHEGEESLNCVPTRFERVKVTEVELTRSMKSRQVKAFTAESIRQDLMDLIERQVKPWMETCQEQGAYHQNCTKKKNTANLPTRLVDSEYSNGVFQRSLAQGLLWYHGSRPGKYTRDENSHLPSWCWAYVCPVDFVNIYQAPIYVRDDHPQRPLNYPTTVKDLSTVEGSVSRLYIRAHIIQLTVEKKEGTNIKEKDSDKAFRYFLDRGSKAKHIVASFIRLFSSGGEMDVLWMPVGRVVDSSSDVVGLLIYKLVEENRVTYHRYGMLRYEWIWNEGVCGDLQEIVLV
ncbi:unnamed protein product [Fusarium graminearum]|uniref:Heterokaryon incompatibility domain-containing protein n=1 Tax=Gibberella zeae TaxID=5518 RepID=A0A4E9DJP8_GIBZA|nr:unnamed protein product [Fusarium graminearum]